MYVYMYIHKTSSREGGGGRAPNRLLIHNWSGDGTHMDEACHANARPISHIRINHVIHI